ncbi:FUSC family protein [Radicibacter daui]|uniref:FUSC family protein n=1 Tax=Radicibacter daui TaxID=3064829 RepID=UPI004046E703
MSVQRRLLVFRAHIRRQLRAALAIARDRISWPDALVAACISALPALLARPLGLPLLGWAAVAAFWTCLSDPGGPPGRRASVMVWVGVGGAFFCLLAGLSADYLWLAVPMTFLCATLAGLARALGPAGTLVGTLLAADFAVSTALPERSLGNSVEYGLYFLAGGLTAILLTQLVWRGRPWRHATGAVAGAYRGVSRMAGDMASLARRQGADRLRLSHLLGHHRIQVRSQIEAARTRLAELAASRHPERAAPLGHLLQHIEREFATLIALADLFEVEEGAADAAGNAARATLLRQLGTFHRLMGQQIARPYAARRAVLEAQIAAIDTTLGELAQPAAHVPATLLQLVRRQHARLAAGLELLEAPQAASRNAPPASTSLLQAVGERNRQQLRNVMGELRRSSGILRHALRLGVATALTVALFKGFNIEHGHWMALTLVFILQPTLSSTFSRALERVVGSVAGSVCAALIGILLPTPALQALAILPVAIASFAARPISYALFTFFITSQFVLVAELQQPLAATAELALARGVNSVAGGLLAVLIGLVLWPESESRRTASAIAKALESHGNYLAALLHAMAMGVADETRLSELRQISSVHNNDANEGLQRLLSRPLQKRRTLTAQLTAGVTIVSALRSVAGTATSLELAGFAPLTPGQSAALHRLAEEMLAALSQVARWMRTGEPPLIGTIEQPDTLPEIDRAGTGRLIQQINLMLKQATGTDTARA